MGTNKIIITEVDRQRLAELLASEFAQAVGPSRYLDDLRSELQRAEIVEPEDTPADVVTMNSLVRILDLEAKEYETYTLVYPNEADIARGRLSVLAPIGTAILGQRVGDLLRWPVPDGWRRLRIDQVVFQPEREEALQL